MTTTTTTATAIDRFLVAIEAGMAIPTDVFAAAAELDATVPMWRFSVAGADAIVAQLGKWFSCPSRFEELTRLPTEHGEVVAYLIRWADDGVPYAAHHCHVLTTDENGLILRDQVWCGGRWDGALLARMDKTGDAD